MKSRNWKEKTLFDTQQIAVAEDSWRWLRNNFLKEKESLILSAQEQDFRTHSIKYSIDTRKTSETLLFRLYVDSMEAVRHNASGRKKLAQRDYGKGHDKIVTRVPMAVYTDKKLNHNRLDFTQAENKEMRAWGIGGWGGWGWGIGGQGGCVYGMS